MRNLNIKQDLGIQIKTLRQQFGVSTYDLEQRGIHPNLPATIEKGKKGYSMDSLVKYIHLINTIHAERGGEDRIEVRALKG
jgi:hypothetical protein